MSLLSLNYTQINQASLENLHHSFAVQLQSLDLWHWSVFVLMHLSDAKQRDKHVQAYLSRNVTGDYELNEKERFIVEKLKVPREWVYEYKALRAKYEHRHENQIRLLMEARKWNEAHAVLIEHLAADYFIQEKWTDLNSFLSRLNAESQTISKWSVGGQIYLNYFHLNEKITRIFNLASTATGGAGLAVLSDSTLTELRDEANSLSMRIKDFDCKTSKKFLCYLTITRMLLKIYNFLNELIGNQSEFFVDQQQQQEMVDEMGDYQIANNDQRFKLANLIEKAVQMTDSVPDKEIYGNMCFAKSKLARSNLNI
jgi:nuclear pore complex protein Nup98-Nup96